MSKLLLTTFVFCLFHCNKSSPKVCYTIKVHYCNEVNYNRDTIFKVVSLSKIDITTDREAVPVIYRDNDVKIVNVCAFDILKADTITQ